MQRLEKIDLNLLTASDSSEDEQLRRPRTMKKRNNLFEELDDLEFKQRFRLNKNSVQHLANRLERVLEPENERNNPISKMNQILICLRYYATGTFQINVADYFNVSQSTVSRIISNITRHIAGLRPEFISMPNTDAEKGKTVVQFHNIAGLPGIIGALDCTHIKIQSPGGHNAEVYRNRKGYFNINSRVLGNAKLRIMDIVARWPGSVHDTTIFNDSNIRVRFVNGEFTPYSNVGDGGYPCRTYLLTPVVDPQTVPQQRYNNAQIRTRNPIERLFGVWKRRFPCLSLGMRLSPQTTCEVIVATAVLHNICSEINDDFDEFDNEELGELEDMHWLPINNIQNNTRTRDSVFGLKDVWLKIPEVAKAGSSVTLTCDYDLESVPLYSIKWYKNEEEFYRYTPKESPPSQVFTLPYLKVDTQNSNEKKVTLSKVHSRTSGQFKCEVTSDGPLFHTDIKEAQLLVVDVPQYGPFLEIAAQKIAPGEMINANCSSPASYPPMNLTWYINDKLAYPDAEFHILNVISRSESFPELDTVQSAISIKSSPEIFRNGKLKLRCLATMFTLYALSKETEIQEDSPQLALIMVPIRQSGGDSVKLHHHKLMVSLTVITCMIHTFIRLNKMVH